MKKQITVRNDPEFKVGSGRGTIDLREYFKDEPEKVEEYEEDYEQDEEEEGDNIMIVSPALRAEKKREKVLKIEKEERESKRPFKYIFFRISLTIFKRILIYFLEIYQNLEQKLNPFQKKYDERRLFFLSISMSDNIKTEKDVLLIYPEFSRSLRYKLLNMRKNALKTYQEVYGKK